MTVRERFLAVMAFQKPADRLPMTEWAPWWHKTLERWHGEGLPALHGHELGDHFGLDRLECVALETKERGDLHITEKAGCEAGYEAIRPFLFSDTCLAGTLRALQSLKPRHDRGEIALRIWLDGFFWFPRTLFGIERHLLAFYDYPELMHRINGDLCAYFERGLPAVFEILTPEMVGFAEDMSYNHGPMLSKALFDEFLAPYYRRLTKIIRAQGVKIFVDTDGDVTRMIPWLQSVGVDGIYPLERQAGVDVAAIRRDHPDLLMLGAFDKMCLSRGEDAIRAEFERLLPVMRGGGFIPSVDHQTPPEVSVEAYRVYLRWFEVYCKKAVQS